MGRGYPPPSRLGGLGERRELPQRDPGRSPGRQRIFGIFNVHMHNTTGRENIVTLLNDVKSPKAACWWYEMKMLQKSNHYHCVPKAHEKNVSQISSMAWSYIRPNNCWNSHQTGNTVHRFRLTASCIHSYDNLLNSFCHQGEVGFIPTVIPTVLNHSLNVWARFTYSTPLVQK